jgi:hypothetical protein
MPKVVNSLSGRNFIFSFFDNNNNNNNNNSILIYLRANSAAQRPITE